MRRMERASEFELCFWCVENQGKCAYHKNAGVYFDDVAVRPFFNDDVFKTVKEEDLINVETHVRYQKREFSLIPTCSQFKAPDGFKFQTSKNMSIIASLRAPLQPFFIPILEKTNKSLEEKVEQKQTETSSNFVVDASGRYVCGVCNKTFTTSHNLGNHALKFHAGAESTNEILAIIAKNGQAAKKKTTNIMKLLEKIAAEPQIEQVSTQNAPAPQVPSQAIAVKSEVPGSFSTPAQIEGNFCCRVCGKNEQSIDQMNEHIALFHSKKNRVWICEYCEQVFDRKGVHRRHIQSAHTDMLHKCTFIGCTHPGYKCRKALKTHCRTVHFIDRLCCDKCEMTFGIQRDLEDHISIYHTKAEKHSRFALCKCLCGLEFNGLLAIVRHQMKCGPFLFAAAESLKESNENSEFRFV